MKKYNEILESVPLFRGISEEERQQMLDCLRAQQQRFAAGAVILWREWKAYQYAKAHKDDPDTWTRDDTLPEKTDTDADADRGGDGT